jgi:hypothetical protein
VVCVGTTTEARSPALDPGNLAAKAVAKIDRSPMQRQLRGSGPKLELVTVTAAAVARVATDRHVYRERAITTTTPRPGLVQRTTSVPLRPSSIRGLEPKQAQYLFHRDFRANSIEVDTGHGCSSLGDTTARCSFDRSVPVLSMGNGNDPPRTISPGVANHQACGKAGRLARAIPAPRPGVRS